MARKDEQNGKKPLKRKQYMRELAKLQAELCKLQDWIKYKGLRVIVVFEGRAAAGSFAWLPLDLVYNRASGSVVDSWVWFFRFCPRKSTSPPAPGGFPLPSLGRKLL